MQEIAKSTPTQSIGIFFKYDPLGNRIKKITAITPISHCFTCVVAPPVYDTTNYARDAQGNILAAYDRKRDSVKLNEWDLYGSKRIGTLDTNLRVYPPVPTYTTVFDSTTISYLEGQKQYELTNHLGNVLATINDRKLSVDTNHDGHTDYYQANTISAGDYYPFGMPIPGRSFKLLPDSEYRFSFNGKLMDKDINGKGNFYDYGMRIFGIDCLPRFLSIDPLASEFPSYSPYMFAADKPIWAVDMDGLEDSTATIVFTPLPQPEPYFHSADNFVPCDPAWLWASYKDFVNNLFVAPLINATNTIKDPNVSTNDKVVTGVQGCN